MTGPSTNDVHSKQEIPTPLENPDILNWRDVVYDIEIKGELRRLVDNVAGWVKPGAGLEE
jgi:hypothetical protein